jgi:DNA-binding transcriptional LysR family regulator
MDRLDAMRLYVRLIELKSFSRAAKELKVTQSTASKWLISLESDLGVTLVERTTRTQHVTAAGEVFYRRAKDIISSYEEMAGDLQSATGEPRGKLRASVPVVFGRLFLVPIAAAYIQRFPKVELEFSFNDRYVNLIEESYDVAVRVGTAVDTSLRTRSLGMTTRILVAAPRYLERAGRLITPDDLSHHECLIQSGSNASSIWVFRAGGKTYRAAACGRFTANNSEALLHLAREGLGLALLADWLVQPDLRAGLLVPVLTSYSAPPAPIHALMSPSRHIHPRVRTFIDYMVTALSKVLPK